MGIRTGGDSWQSKPWRHRGDNLPITRMHRRGICYTATSMPSAMLKAEGSRPATPQPVPFQGMNYSSGLVAKHHRELPQQAPHSCINSYPGKVLSKTTGISSAVLWKGGNTAQAAARRAVPYPLGALLNHTAYKPWGQKRQNIHLQSINTDHSTKTLFQSRAQQGPCSPEPGSTEGVYCFS